MKPASRFLKPWRRVVGLAAAVAVSLAVAAPALAYTSPTGSPYQASDLVTGYPNYGPFGIALGPDGSLYSDDEIGGGLYKYPAGSANLTRSSTDLLQAGLGRASLAFAADGHLYAAKWQSIVELSPQTGATLRTVLIHAYNGNACSPLGFTQDPVTGDFLLDTPCGLFRESMATGKETLVTPGQADGLAVAPDGTIYRAATNAVQQIAGLNTARPGAVLATAAVGGADGIAIVRGEANAVLVNSNSGFMASVVFAPGGATVTRVITGATRGDFVAVGPDGCMYADEVATIAKVTDADGSCSFVPMPVFTGAALPGSSLAYTGPANATYGEPIPVSGRLTTTDGSPISGVEVTFTLGGQSCGATTLADGTVACQIPAGDDAGSYTLSAAFGGNAAYAQSAATAPFTVLRAPTTIAYTGPSSAAAGSTQTLGGILLASDTGTPIGGQTVTLDLGGQTCEAASLADGTASCPVTLPVDETLGPITSGATFGGDQNYLPSNASASGYAFAWPAGGSFVVGDVTPGPTVGASADYWGARWAANNTLSVGSPAPAFKGFEDSASPAACGVDWSADPGNSTPPPASVPAYMGVIVTSTVSQAGPVISGTTPHLVVVRTDRGYSSDPGHSGTGTIVAVVC